MRDTPGEARLLDLREDDVGVRSRVRKRGWSAENRLRARGRAGEPGAAQFRRPGRLTLRGVAVAITVACVLSTACATPPRWQAADKPDERDAEQLFREAAVSGIHREMHAGEIPEIPVRSHLRPCCAFGSQLRAKLGPIPIPGYCIGNVTEREALGKHRYDSGVVQVGSRVDDSGLIRSERNGLVYTCRGGFIDTAHVRDYVDWAIFLATNIGRNLEVGLDLRLPDEGGHRRIVVEPVDPATIARVGRRALALELGQWLAFQLSVWHEIATWFGWSSISLFPEKVSAFSPEDVYSNLIGVRIAAAIASQRAVRDESLYNRSVDQWLDRVLGYLGAVPTEVGGEAMDSVDGLWWDSSARLPEPDLVLRRNMDVGAIVTPWLIPPDRMGPALRAACGTHPEAIAMANPNGVRGAPFSTRALLVIDVAPDLAEQAPFAGLSGRVTDKDFPAIIDVVRSQNRVEFGAEADQPR